MANRSAPALLGCFGALLGCAPEELLVSQDRWCLYRPTTDARGEEAHPEWRTDTKLHLDLKQRRHRGGLPEDPTPAHHDVFCTPSCTRIRCGMDTAVGFLRTRHMHTTMC